MATKVDIAIVNSTGPMASSVIAAIIEKFGYLNIPVRKLGMDRYICGELPISDEFMKDRFRVTLESADKETRVGGVSILHRDSTDAQKRIDKDIIANDVQKILEQSYSDIASMYDDMRGAYAKAVQYKSNSYHQGKHVELAVDLYKWDPKAITEGYINAFNRVTMVHMHRDIVGWIESLASQYMRNDVQRYKFRLGTKFKQYFEYEDHTRHLPGIHVFFDKLFEPNTRLLLDELAIEFGEPTNDIKWEEEEFDLYGNMTNYKMTFNQADKPGTYLSKMSRFVIKCLAGSKNYGKLKSLIFYPFYLFDLYRFSLARKSG